MHTIMRSCSTLVGSTRQVLHVTRTQALQLMVHLETSRLGTRHAEMVAAGLAAVAAVAGERSDTSIKHALSCSAFSYVLCIPRFCEYLAH